MDSQINQAVAGGNEKMIMESLNWLVSTEETETVSIPSKSLQVSPLTPTAYDVSFWKICMIGLIPGVFLVIGFGIWPVSYTHLENQRYLSMSSSARHCRV